MNANVNVYAGTAGHSAWFSEDAGETWVHPNSHSGMYLEARVWSLASCDAVPEHVYAGTDCGVFRWDERIARWAQLPSPMTDVWAVAIDPSDPSLIIAGTRPANLFRSTDAGANWSPTQAPQIVAYSQVNMGPTRVTQILFDPVNPGTVWASVEIGGIFRSTDRGQTWTMLDRGLVSADVHGLAVTRKANGASVIFATTNRGLHRSEDGGAHWQFQSLPLPWQYTRTIVARADDPSVLYLTSGNGPPGNDGRLLRSCDHGDSWQTLPLPGTLNSTVWCVAVHAADPLMLFACTHLGQMFRSLDGGERWTRLAQEFGELRALHWRPVAPGMRIEPHSLTRKVVRIP